MMLRDLAMGAALVFIILALFLEIKLAFWVMLGIPVCFLGAMALINTPYIDASLNMISIFNDVIGPIMRGPSSSHCAAALRIGRLARDLMRGQIDSVLVAA